MLDWKNKDWLILKKLKKEQKLLKSSLKEIEMLKKLRLYLKNKLKMLKLVNRRILTPIGLQQNEKQDC